VDAVRLGRAVTAVRVKLRRTQSEVAHRAGVSRSTVARIEHGDASSVTLGTLQKVGEALGIQVALVARWRGGEIDRLIDAGHAAMHEAMARRLGRLAGWLSVPEVSFAIYAERGVIDILAWHSATRSLLIIELKTILMNVSELIGVMDRRRRLAFQIAASRGWRPETVSVWVILAETMTNRRRFAEHKTVLRAAFPADGRAMREWLRSPGEAISALSFLSYDHEGDRTWSRTRVRHRAVPQRRGR
jgi:transcriptional regulator with XRE-family HTH domain